MKKIVTIALITGCMSGLLNASNFDLGISGSDTGVNGFSLSIGDYYRAPAQEVVVIERSVARDELSVVYFLARQSHKSPRYITDLRVRGNSWWDISLRLGLNPNTLYVVDSRRYSQPPYGNAYGYRNGGKNHRLGDNEIVELVNVRFLSDYHHVSVDEVIDRRRGGEQYNRIDERYRGKNQNREQRVERKEDRGNMEDRGDYGQGRGRGNNR